MSNIKMCMLCTTNPSNMEVKGYPICHNCAGKWVNKATDVVGLTADTKGSLVTGAVGLFLLAALAGTVYIYAKYPATADRMSNF